MTLVAAYPTRVAEPSERSFKAQIRPIDVTISPVFWGPSSNLENPVSRRLRLERNVRRDGMIAVVDTISKAGMMSQRSPATRHLNIGADTLILAGEEDKISPEAAYSKSNYNEERG